MNQLRRVSGTVLKLHCSSCRKTFPHFSFSGDTDMVTLGLGSVTSCERNEVVLAEFSAGEWNDLEVDGAARFERRLRKLLDRDDLRVVRLLAVEETATVARGVSSQKFLKQYRPPNLVFSCANCEGGQSRPISEATVDEFEQGGGRISVVGGLSTR
jgi:hypothetical protein